MADTEAEAACRKLVEAVHDSRLHWQVNADSSDEWIYDELGSVMSSAYFAARDVIRKKDQQS